MRSWPWLVVAVSIGCASNPRRDEAVSRANAARARGDHVAEAVALREACGFARDDKDLCKRADQAVLAAHGASQRTARAACADVQPTLAAVDGCLAAVAEIRKLAPQDPEASRFAEVAGRQHLALCAAGAPSWQTSIDAAVELVRCHAARAAQIAVPSYTEQLLSTRAEVRDQILRLAETPPFAERPGAIAELVAAAACLAPSRELGERARGARGAFVDRARATIDLRATTSTLLPDLCAIAASALGDRAICGAPRARAPQLTIIGEIVVAPVEHSAIDSVESKQYVAGIIRFENPDYQPAVRGERDARQSKDQAESSFRRDESDCRSADSALSSQASTCSSGCPARDERDRACNRKSTSESLYRQRQSDWESASRRLANTPSMSEREDIRTATYTVRTHTWRALWRAQFRNDARSIPAGGEIAASDRETAGAPVAGVPSDPMTNPGNRWFVEPIRDQIAAKLAEIADTALKRRSSDLAVSCGGAPRWTPDWLDCWARVRFWGGAPPELDALLRLVGEASDRGQAPREPVRCVQ